MEGYDFLIETKEIKEKNPVLVKKGLKKYIVYLVNGNYTVFDAHCPHARANLYNGKFNDNMVQCHWHGYKFNIESGKGLNNSFELKLYDVKIESGKIFVREKQDKEEGLFFPEVKFKGEKNDK